MRLTFLVVAAIGTLCLAGFLIFRATQSSEWRFSRAFGLDVPSADRLTGFAQTSSLGGDRDHYAIVVAQDKKELGALCSKLSLRPDTHIVDYWPSCQIIDGNIKEISGQWTPSANASLYSYRSRPGLLRVAMLDRREDGKAVLYLRQQRQ